MLKDGTADARLKFARQLCPDFPVNYDFATNPRKKLARLQADYEERSDVIRAVFAAESDDFKAVLLREFQTVTYSREDRRYACQNACVFGKCPDLCTRRDRAFRKHLLCSRVGRTAV